MPVRCELNLRRMPSVTSDRSPELTPHLRICTRSPIVTKNIFEKTVSYVESGGTLVIDAAGGSVAFAAAMESELEKTFGADPAGQLNQPVPPSHPLYSAKRQAH